MNKRTRKIIQDINDSVPKELRARLFKREFVAPDLRLAVREKVKNLKGKEQQRLQNIIDAGYYDATKLVVDPAVAKEMEDYVNVELDKAIAEGRIPHPKDDRQYQSFIRKLKQDEKRKQRDQADQEPPIGGA